MFSVNDVLFICWLLISFGLIVLMPGRLNKRIYSSVILLVFIMSCLATFWFHETVIDVSQSSPLHGALLSFAQIGILTLSSKVWLAINDEHLGKALRKVIVVSIYTSLTIIIFGSYWLYKMIPELQIVLYPLASIAISFTAQLLEDRIEKTHSN